MLRLDRLRALVDVYPGVEREDEMVAAFDYCLHGKGGAAPSIDTAMHGLVDAAHVDHLHPDSGIAIATAADGEALTKESFGDRVVWVPWRRPGFQLGLDIAAIKEQQPAGDRLHPRRPRHHRVGRHERGVPRRTRCGSSTPPRRSSPSTAGPSRSAPRSRGTPRCPRPSAARRPPRSRRRSAASPRPTGRRSATSPTPTSCSTSWPRAEHPRLAALGTSCPDHFLRTKVRPLVLDLPATAPVEESIARLKELHAAYREDYPAYYDRHATAGLARRCAAPTRRSCWCPASACSASARTSRPPAWPASSTSTRST